jgi:oligopeptide transport system substrate-binding protein
MHAQAARALEELYEGQTDPISVELAHHYSQAGEGQKAVVYLLKAGDRARLYYAFPEAIAHYSQALRFFQELGEHEQAARTLMKLGLTYNSAGEFERSRQVYQEGFALWQKSGSSFSTGSLPLAPRALQIQASYQLISLDPPLVGDAPSSKVIEQIFSGLVQLNEDLDVVPEIAESWETFRGGQEYCFHLKAGWRWTDGKPITAYDFEYAWKRVLDPKLGSPFLSSLLHLRGAKDFYNGDPSALGVHAVDPLTLSVQLEHPASYFLYLLTLPGFFPVPMQSVETHGSAWSELGRLITNGPFFIESYDTNHGMTLRRNPNYRGQFSGNLERVHICWVEEFREQLRAYETGKLDILGISMFPPKEIVVARQRFAGEYISKASLTTFFIGFDTRRPPFDDVRVRRAFAMAVDREFAANINGMGLALPATGGFIPPGMPGHLPGLALPFQPEAARRLLAEAGYPGGRGFPSIQSCFPKGNFVKALFDEPWRKNLGVDIPLEQFEIKDFLIRRLNDPPHLFGIGWGADYPDPENFLHGNTFLIQTGWKNSEYSDLIEQARLMTNQETRLQSYARAEHILVDEAPILPLLYGRQHWLIKPAVKKFPIAAMGNVQLKDIIILLPP